MPEKTQSLNDRVLETLIEKRWRILNGKINCIPWGLPRFQEQLPGIERGKYYLVTANSKVGKTQIADFLFVFNVAKQIVDGSINTNVKIFYFTLEMTKEEKMLSCFAHILSIMENIRIAPKDLKSTNAENPLSEEVIEILRSYKAYFDKIEEIVEFVDDVRHGYGMFNMVKNFMDANGTIHYKTTTFEKFVDGEIITETRESRDFYEPNDPELYVLMIIDHVGLISTESRNDKKLDLYECISLLSSDYLIRLRNFYGVSPVVVQQQASSQESVENKKNNRLKPSLDGLGENKTTQRDANVILGLFSPMRHEIREYGGYDITRFRDNIRFLEILGGREGGAGTICPLFFDGAVNVFKELPLPSNTPAMEKVYLKLKEIQD